MTSSLTSLDDMSLDQQAHHCLRLSTLQRYANPLGCWPELSGVAITAEEVNDCLERGDEALRKTPSWFQLAFSRQDITPEDARRRHIQKVAYFVRHPATDPISLDVTEGIGHIVEDGNHRLAGALLRGDKTILAKVAGDPRRAQEMKLWNPSLAVLEQLRRWGVAEDFIATVSPPFRGMRPR